MNMKRCVPALVLGAFACAAFVLLSTRPSGSQDDPDLLQLVEEGCAQAAGAIRTGQGVMRIKERYWNELGAGEIEHTYRVAFVGNRYRRSVETRVVANEPSPSVKPPRSWPKDVVRAEIVFDGSKVTSYSPANKRAVITDTASGGEAAEDHCDFVRAFLSPAPGLVDIRKLGFRSSDRTSVAPPKVVGKADLEGRECILVAVTARSIRPNKECVTLDRIYWVDPARGFSVPRFQAFAQGDRYKERTLLVEENAVLRQYLPEVWYPERVTRVEYGIDEHGQSQMKGSTSVEYDPEFRINVSVEERELLPDLPSGTRVRDRLAGADYTVP